VSSGVVTQHARGVPGHLLIKHSDPESKMQTEDRHASSAVQRACLASSRHFFSSHHFIRGFITVPSHHITSRSLLIELATPHHFFSSHHFSLLTHSTRHQRARINQHLAPARTVVCKTARHCRAASAAVLVVFQRWTQCMQSSPAHCVGAVTVLLDT
jgi:hypothetical protein